MPPEISELFKDWPAGILLVFLASPWLTLFGVIVNAVVKRFSDRETHKAAKKAGNVSEMEAETHQFQVIVEGFTKSLEVVEKRAVSAEKKADAAELKAGEAKDETEKLEKRVKTLEDERDDAIDHVILLESLIPYPPGPPTRPLWMQRHPLQ